MVSAEFRSLQVSLGATLFGRFAEPQVRKSWRKVIMVVAQRFAKSYIFVGTISGARKRWNFATVLRGTSTVGKFTLNLQETLKGLGVLSQLKLADLIGRELL